MKRKLFDLILFLIINILIFGGELNIIQEKEEEIPKYKAYLIADTHGNILKGENIEEKFPLASITKMMTLTLAYEALEEGKIQLTDKVKMDANSNKMGGSRIWIKTGTEITVEDLIKATAIHSANNAAYALASYIEDGNIHKFVKKMNKKAMEFGLENELEFHTPTGLPPSMTGEKMDVGTVYGIYKLSEKVLENKEYIAVASKEKTKIFNGRTKLLNRNKLLGKKGIHGIKTGHHDTAGYNISIVSKINNMKILYVVFGSPDEKIRDEKVIEDIEYVENNYNEVRILNKDIPLAVVDIENGFVNKLEIFPDIDLEMVRKNNENIFIYIDKPKIIKAPLEKNKSIGKYYLFVGNVLKHKGNLVNHDYIKSIK